ncbi:undecaprenyl-diphosphatase [Rhodospirillum rubrum]|uniref:undecaprenyl-diphosphate phosphatase n=1 Tax=Rhodospirillum rubrum TaxID=1085 RepID=UPI001907FC6E|nr:undecaprenyl-diphosphate phosphatase [Rhodospirillum rubrum]MBK1664736.1 undecaprenyl-diphosphatase [Rhodospirillum rubrum]MBK1676340.1 undecaprenyl-diphosphatase [Rhodospirillum rubrum]
MDLVMLIKAVILGLVEGITEFLPISSTGHLIIAGSLLDFLDEQKRDVFVIVIQLGAILAVCWEYRRRLTDVVAGLGSDPQSWKFVTNLLVAFLPAVVLGLTFGKVIKANLFSPVPVATAFIVGGLVILWAERRRHPIRVREVDEMTWVDALKIGLAQCFALIPGTSRSGATIIGGLFFGLSRKAATEFSFFLAIPTLTAASLYDLYKNRALLDGDMSGLMAVGFVVSFLSALVAVRGLIRYISRHDFTVFAWYRIAFGLVVLATAWSGLVSWSA